jgi:DNA-binding response OmpR family regulator
MARILLIDDDDEPVRTTLRLTLEHVGHTVIEARDTKAAWETTRDRVIDFADDVVRFVSRPFCPLYAEGAV